MKNITYVYIAIVLAFNLDMSTINATEPSKLRENSYRIATYNIRYRASDDIATGNAWELRKKPVADLITNHSFDIIATQEGDADQIQDLVTLLPDFGHVGHTYGGKNHSLHTCATFYRKSLFDVMEQGIFWLSETPDIPSVGWDASDQRICYWTKFRAKDTGKEFFIFNVHFYWRKSIAREKSGYLLINKITEIAKNTPAITLGDFNSSPDSPQISHIKSFMHDAYEKTKTPPQGVINTAFPGGVFTGVPEWRLDYIFVSPSITIRDFKVLSDTYSHDKHPSDHLPVVSEVSL